MKGQWLYLLTQNNLALISRIFPGEYAEDGTCVFQDLWLASDYKGF
jgi:hypothetical protein